jgi:hypothetical protein
MHGGGSLHMACCDCCRVLLGLCVLVCSSHAGADSCSCLQQWRQHQCGLLGSVLWCSCVAALVALGVLDVDLLTAVAYVTPCCHCLCVMASLITWPITQAACCPRARALR